MRTTLKFWIAGFCLLLFVEGICADSIWARRDPYFSKLFEDNRARRVGDVVTVVLRETTFFQGLERRDLNKLARDRADFTLAGTTTTTGNANRAFTANLNGVGTAQRTLDARANVFNDRRFNDSMTVVVVDVWPNGNLVVKGYRDRGTNSEDRMMTLTGVIRPLDIFPDNTIESRFIANMTLSYRGRGQESAYQNNGWWGRILNGIWPW